MYVGACIGDNNRCWSFLLGSFILEEMKDSIRGQRKSV